MPDEPPVDCSGNPVGGGNSGGGGGGASGCEPWLAGCVGFTGGGAPLTGEQAYGPGYSPVPDVHPVAASYPVAAQAGSVDGPGCNPMLFKYGACPSESGAAGTTPQEVRQSALGALGVLLGALPIGDLLDLAIGSAAEDSGLADAAVSCGGMSFAPGTKVLLASGIPQAKVGTGLVCGGCGQQSGLPFSRIRAVSGEEEEPVRRTRDRHRERVGIGFLHTWQKCSMFV